MGLQVARGTDADRPGRRSLGKLEGHDSGWHGDDSIADDHQHGRQDPPEDSVRGNISIAYCGYCDDRPIYRGGYAGEAVRLSFDLIHHRADNNDDREDGKKKDGYFANTLLQSDAQNGGLADVFSHLENAEDAEQAKRT